MKYLTGWPLPAALALLFVALVWTSDAQAAGTLAAVVGLALVLLFWAMFREAAAHAEVSRALAIGDVAAALTLTEAQMARRKGRRRAPFALYHAQAHELAGRWRDCLRAVEEAKVESLTGGGAASWRMVAACTSVGAHCELGQVAAARALFDGQVAPRAAELGPGASLPAQLALGRLLLAEGDAEAARKKLTPLARHIRLGPAQRGMTWHYLALAADALGDDQAATSARGQARALAPQCWFASSGAPPAGADDAGARAASET